MTGKIIESVTSYGVGKEFFSWRYLLTQFCTLAIFTFGFKWTLLALYWITFDVYNPFVYGCIILFWFFYNFSWLRIALYLPSSMLIVGRTYRAAGIEISLWRTFYLALCKVNKLRKEDFGIQKAGLVRALSRMFIKHGVALNFTRPEAEDLSKALFIQKKRKVFSYFKGITPFIFPAFMAILILTPATIFLSSFNYHYMMARFTDVPVLMTFSIYLTILPFSIVWVFLTLDIVARNFISPLAILPAADLYGEFIKNNKIELKLDKPQRPSAESVLALFMICASVAFYISTLAAQYAVIIENWHL